MMLNVAPFLEAADQDDGEEVTHLEEYGKAESEGHGRDPRVCNHGDDQMESLLS